MKHAYFLLFLAGCFPTVTAPCSVLDASCGAGTLECNAHAPDFAAEFAGGAMVARYPVGATAEVTKEVMGPVTITSVTADHTVFTGPGGLEGDIETLTPPSCSDGHFYDAAPYQLTITASPDLVPTGPICCVVAP